MQFFQLRGRLAALGPAFGLLLLSDMLMLLSLMVGHVVIPWWVAHAGGAADLAIYAAGLSACSFVALPLLSPLGDRVSKRHLLAGGMLAMGIESLVLAAMAQFGSYDLAAIMALELVNVIAMAAIMPASFSIVAELLPADRLTEGLGLQKSAQAVGRLMGPALGGLVLAAAGTAVSLWLHAALLLAGAALAARIEVVVPARAAAARAWLADLRAGLRAKWAIPLERGWTFVSFLVMLFFVPGIGMLVPLKVQSLGLSAVWLGACEASLALGMLLGSLGGSVWIAQRIGRFNASFGAILLEGVAMVIIGLSREPVVIVATFALIGGATATVQMVGQTHRMLAMPQAFRARMTAVNMMVMQIAGVLGPGLAGLMVVHGGADGTFAGGVDGTYWLMGLGLFAVGLLYLRVPDYRSFLDLPHAQAEGRYARDYPALFR